MHHSLATLLSLSILLYACCVESEVDHRFARRATDLFTFTAAGSPGSCTAAEQDLVSSWIADAITLNTAALAAYGFGIGLPDAVHLSSIMGIKFTSPGQTATDQYRTNYMAMGGECSPQDRF